MKKLFILFFAITLTLTSIAQVTKTLNVTTAGTLSTLLNATEKTTVTNLTLTGNIDARDIKCMRDEMTKLAVIDMSEVNIKDYTGNGGTSSTSNITYPANEMPEFSFHKTNLGKVTLTTIELPNSLTSIGNTAFSDCTGLMGSLTVPNKVTNIGNLAFNRCTGLSGSLTIPNSVTSIGGGAFSNCTGLTGILTIPTLVTSIGNFAFYRCTGLTGSLTIPNSVTNIGSSAFSGCTGLNGSLNLPNSITSIGSSAFQDCYGIYGTITFPTTLTNIGNDAFSGCRGFIITCLKTTPISTTVSSMGINNSIVYVPAGTLSAYKVAWAPPITVLIQEQDVIANINSSTVGTLATNIFNRIGKHPSLVTKLTVTGVLNSADIYYIRDNMQQCYDVNLENVNLTDFPNDAFKNRPLLYFVKLPSNLKTIGESAFYNCSLLKSMTIPNGVTSIGNFAFKQCSSLNDISLGNTLTSIGNSAFYQCLDLKTLELPNTLTSLGYFGTFFNCSNLESINLPNGLNSIPSSTFSMCSKLKTINIPLSITTVDSQAFIDCFSLTSIVLGAKVTSIGERAFDGCSKVTEITSYRLTPPALGTGAFNGINPQTCKLRILQEADFGAYFNAPQWGSFLNVERITGLNHEYLDSDNDTNPIQLKPQGIIINTNQSCELWYYDMRGSLLQNIKSTTGELSIPYANQKLGIVKVLVGGEVYVRKVLGGFLK